MRTIKRLEPATMSLPADLEHCLQKHSQSIINCMVPDGVYVYLSGAKLLTDDDHTRFHQCQDGYSRNHLLLKAAARNGQRGFESFLEALETTRQYDLAHSIRHDLISNHGGVEGIGKIKNDIDDNISALTSPPRFTSYGRGVPSSSTSFLSQSRVTGQSGTPSYLMPERRSSADMTTPTPRRSSSLTARTPLTPPLSESELLGHLERMKKLLHKISSTHADRTCRQEARDLMGDLDEAGDSMMIKLRELSDENAEKEKELRNAKYMVRGMEAEIQRMKTKPPVGGGGGGGEHGETSTGATGGGKQSKSKLCVIL